MTESIKNKLFITFLYENRWKLFADGLWTTLLLTVASFAFGILLGAAFAAMKLSKRKWIRTIANFVTGVLIQLPTMVILMIFAYVIFGNVFSVEVIAIIGLTIKSGSYIGDIIHTAILSVNAGEAEAARSLGMTAWQTFRFVTLPQAVKKGLPLFKNQFVITLQETSIVGYLAIQDLTRASSIVTSRTYDALFGLISVSLLYLIIGAIGSGLIGLLDREKHIGGERK